MNKMLMFGIVEVAMILELLVLTTLIFIICKLRELNKKRIKNE